MKNFILPAAGAVGLLLAACIAAPGEIVPVPDGGSAPPATGCLTTERMFNGACRGVCNASAQCSGANTCMNVAPDLAVCIDYTSCAYLGSDTICKGVAHGSYVSYNTYSSYAAVDSCAGNATWQSSPANKSSAPSCGVEHAVTRCQNVGNRCSLVNGFAQDLADR